MTASNRRLGLRLATYASTLLVFALTAAAADEKVLEANASTQASGVSARQGAAVGRKMDEYQIGPHDLLDISVFQVSDLSRTVRVNARGIISLPLIGTVQAGGLTAEQLENSIAKKLGESYLQDPQVSVFIREYISQRVTVEGSVQKSGVYQLTGPTTLLQAIAMASGVDPLADENAVKVFREKDGQRTTLVYDLEAIRSGKVQDPTIKGDDVVVVEKSSTRSAVKDVADTIRGILSFGRY